VYLKGLGEMRPFPYDHNPPPVCAASPYTGPLFSVIMNSAPLRSVSFCPASLCSAPLSSAFLCRLSLCTASRRAVPLKPPSPSTASP